MPRKLAILFMSLVTFVAHGADTPCASRVFADALAQTANKALETAHETDIQTWIYQTFAVPDVLNKVLACPEIANVPDDEIIKFIPIQYIFPGGREIVVNYETQPRVLKQRLILANKRNLSSGGDSPRIGATGDDAIWTNTDPAWYAIMVTEHGALDEFVGPDKNNTISLNYIKNNINKLFPSGRGGKCTDRSAKSRDITVINKVMSEHTVNIKDDTNDYYVAGDVNLQWLSYAEMALDVVITVATFGAGTMVMGTTKAARASRALKGMSTTLRTLSKSDDVVKYVRAVRQAEKLTDEIKTLDKVADATKIADKTDELKKLQNSIKDMEKIDDVKKYRDTSRAFSEANAVRRGLRAVRNAQRGNIVARLARATKAAWTGGAKINKAAKLGRTGKISARVRDRLFNFTMKNIGALGKMQATGGLLYGAIKFAGDMYDWTETSTGEFTSGVDFAPLLLLSADDLQGQENVVNHGMWLMWVGDSVSAADDDAAYLQAMDFAAKFHQDLSEYQNNTASPCNVDIFVVRPVLRNPGSENPELYYLIMNDVPWTTNE
ncbi:MAG: hypothetical protein R8M70_03700 [Alphaproteobacteria bacterium]|nr:hypothetical protein [Alphaproteobacteria bacterium]